MSRKIKVTNRSDSQVGYFKPDTNNSYSEDFLPGQTKELDYEEIKKLYWTVGGRRLIEEYFVITDEDFLNDVNIVPEPEYFYTEEDIKTLLLDGSYEQLEDTLEFGPKGVLDLVKDMAVDLEIPDVNKRNLISKKTGLDISKAIEFKKANEAPVEEEKKIRRAEPVKAAEAKPAERKAAPVGSKYTIKK